MASGSLFILPFSESRRFSRPTRRGMKGVIFWIIIAMCLVEKSVLTECQVLELFHKCWIYGWSIVMAHWVIYGTFPGSVVGLFSSAMVLGLYATWISLVLQSGKWSHLTKTTKFPYVSLTSQLWFLKMIQQQASSVMYIPFFSFVIFCILWTLLRSTFFHEFVISLWCSVIGKDCGGPFISTF